MPQDGDAGINAVDRTYSAHELVPRHKKCDATRRILKELMLAQFVFRIRFVSIVL